MADEKFEYYFAYGSNLNAERMAERKVAFTSREHAILDGYQLKFAFNSGNGYGSATIVPKTDAVVHGALYTIEKGGLDKLDIFEWVPRGGYERVAFKVKINNGELADCIAYVATKEYFKEGLIPSKGYLAHLLKGKDLLPSSYYEFLESHECGN